MKVKEVIDVILKSEGLTRYRLAKRLNVHESILSRAYNEISDPGFGEVTYWAEAIGYEIFIRPKANKSIDEADKLDINGFGRIINSIDCDEYDYLAIHRKLKQLLENASRDEDIKDISYYPGRIKNRNWRAFYAATIAYLAKQKNASIPAFALPKSNRTSQAWSPIHNLGKSHTEFDRIYADYNVLLPEGELVWI